MDIKSVKLTSSRPPSKKGEKPLDDLFFVVTKDGNELTVPQDPMNRHYNDIREWYGRQKKQPFNFTFEEPEENDAGTSTPILTPQQEPTEPEPDMTTKDVNLTAKQLREISKADLERRRRLARRDGDSQES